MATIREKALAKIDLDGHCESHTLTRMWSRHHEIMIDESVAGSGTDLAPTLPGTLLADHVEWHLRDALAPLPFHDAEPTAARAERSSPVIRAESPAIAKAKKATERSVNGRRVMRFADLMDHLGTLTRNSMRVSLRGAHPFTPHATPSHLQQTAFGLLDREPLRVQQAANQVANSANRIKHWLRPPRKTSA